MVWATCIDCGRSFDRDVGEEWKSRCVRCFIKHKNKEGFSDARTYAKREMVKDPIRQEVADHMRALLMLCHPDKHANSDVSTRVTQWLLNVRERVK